VNFLVKRSSGEIKH